jgi:2-dehydropantoate 2-reductase
MKVCVYGCGAIGSLIAVRLAAAGAIVSVVARGAHLDAIRSNGLQLVPLDGGEPETVQVVATDNPAELGEQDVVFLTMKSHAVPAVAAEIAPLLGDNTLVVTAANGIPWWYFHGLAGDAREIASVDPGLKLWNAIGPERAIGCVVYPAAKIESPGVVRHVFGDRLTIGVPDGRSHARVNELAKLLESAGFVAPVQDDIRVDIWTKLVANAAFNPVSVMTGKTLGEMIDDQATCELLRKIMAEVVAVAAAYDVVPAMSPDELLAATRQLGSHKTSMLQDLEAGRSLELAPIVGAVIEMAGMSGVAVPNLTMAHQLAAARATP